MTSDVRTILSPLLIVSYVFGTKIIEFPVDKPRLFLSLLYILLWWSIYHFFLSHVLVFYVHKTSTVFKICYCLNVSTAILSVVLGIYYDKKFRSCLRKLAIVDDTLGKIGCMTNYRKLYNRVLLTVFGFVTVAMWITYTNAIGHGEYQDVILPHYITFIIKYPTYVNIIGDIIITSTLGYIEEKFDQINRHLQKFGIDNEHAINYIWEYSALLTRQNRYSKPKNNEYVTWIVIHLHLELRKISRELNSIFGLQVTVKMGTYFTLIILASYNICNIMFIPNYGDKKNLNVTLIVTFIVLNIYRLFIINYMCEKVSNKANATGDVISKIKYSTFDEVVRENISQFLLQMKQAPLKFHGLGLFQFGLNFFYGFSSSVTTVIVILVQSHADT